MNGSVLGKIGLKWEGNIKLGLNEKRWPGLYWFNLGHVMGQVAGTSKQGNETSVSTKCLNFFN
jgi:hypothetical protein